jgi:CPA2 family monovalent cation:H+ antiporter-2
MDFTFFNQLILIFSLSVIVIAFFKRFQIPEILGYLFVGITLSANTFGIISQDFDMTLLAEIGVVFLLFTLGLEFSLKTMVAMKREVFGIGGLQVASSVLIIFGILSLFHFDNTVSLIFASALSLSSTAIVSKELTQSNETRSRYGQISISVLLFQDIAAVLFLIMVPTLAGGTGQSFAFSMIYALLKGTIFVIGMLAIGKWILPKIFHEIATARSEELFVLMALVVALIAAWISHTLGLSMALGGFVAGMMMAESKYRHQVEADIKPFRDVLLGLFFVSVGLMLDYEILKQHLIAILISSVSLIILKFSILYVISRLLTETKKNSFKAGISLAQGGEFCFALIAVFTQYNSNDDLPSIIIAVTLISMIVSPILIRNKKNIYSLLSSNKAKDDILEKQDTEEINRKASEMQHHTLICGYGRVGQIISRFLVQENKPYIAVDDDPMHVREASLAKDPVFFGDCRNLEILQAVGIDRAYQVVVCVDCSETAIEIVKVIRTKYPLISILVRVRSDKMTKQIQAAGANVVIPEVLESSLVIVKQALLMLGVEPAIVLQRINEAREKGYEVFGGFYPSLNDFMVEASTDDHRKAVTINESCKFVGKSIAECDFAKYEITIVQVRRGTRLVPIHAKTIILKGDTLVFKGTSASLSKIENLS